MASEWTSLRRGRHGRIRYPPPAGAAQAVGCTVRRQQGYSGMNEVRYGTQIAEKQRSTDRGRHRSVDGDEHCDQGSVCRSALYRTMQARVCSGSSPARSTVPHALCGLRVSHHAIVLSSTEAPRAVPEELLIGFYVWVSWAQSILVHASRTSDAGKAPPS